MRFWVDAVCRLGGARDVARAGAGELDRRYAESHRRYHNGDHVTAVVRDSAVLAEQLALPARERAVLALAAAAHDVVYDGKPGDDERRSADWAHDWLTRAGVGEPDCLRVATLILATIAHNAPSADLTALALLDADLAVLGADTATYDGYRAAVRQEYARYDDVAWRTGRAAVLIDLAARDPLFMTEPARQRWAAAAKANLARELASLA